MNILGHIEAVHEAMREVEWRLEQANICTTIVDWRLIDDVYPFYSKIVYDSDVGFCTVIGTLDDDYHVRDIFHGIEFYHHYDDLVIDKSNTQLFEEFLESVSPSDLNELIHNEMGV